MELEKKELPRIHIAIIGTWETGKASLLQTFLNDGVKPNEPIISKLLSLTQIQERENYSKIVEINKEKYEVVFWVQSGRDRFRQIPKKMVEQFQGAMFVFDVSRRWTYRNIESNLQVFLDNVKRKQHYVVVGNKSELQHELLLDEVERFLKSNHLEYFETSMVNEQNLDKPFKWIINQILGVNKKEVVKLQDKDNEKSLQKSKCI